MCAELDFDCDWTDVGRERGAALARGRSELHVLLEKRKKRVEIFFGELFQAQNAFQQLVGVYINGYAFGDIDQLVPIIERVQREGKPCPINKDLSSLNLQAEVGMGCGK